MADRPTLGLTPPSETPAEFPSVPPTRDLYPTSDIRFVMLEIGKLTSSVDRLIADVQTQSQKIGEMGKLTTQVERLITDVKSQSDKVDALRHTVTYVKGGIAVVVAVGALITFVMSGKAGQLVQWLISTAK